MARAYRARVHGPSHTRAILCRMDAEFRPLPGVGSFPVPSDILEDVFPLAVRDQWRKRWLVKPSDELLERLNILCACGPRPICDYQAHLLGYWKACKSAWHTYMLTAFACGVFEVKGQSLRGRLTSDDPNGFRGAMAECMACWFLAGRMKLPLSPYAPGRDGSNLEMQLVFDTFRVGVEVKAPQCERPHEIAFHADDSAKIAAAIASANKQFSKDCPNILVLVPRLRRPIDQCRNDLIRAAIGQTVIQWDVPLRDDLEPGPTRQVFVPSGKLLNPIKGDGEPGHRRISLILVIEEMVQERHPMPMDLVILATRYKNHSLIELIERKNKLNRSPLNISRIDHNVLVVHNPHAYHPLNNDWFGEFPQLDAKKNARAWSDGVEFVV